MKDFVASWNCCAAAFEESGTEMFSVTFNCTHFQKKSLKTYIEAKYKSPPILLSRPNILDSILPNT